MYDFHTHILPEMDDGSKSVDMSIAMLKKSKDDGITNIALTPHFYATSEDPQMFLKRRTHAFDLLRPVIEKGGLEDLRLILGAEVAYYRGMGRSEQLTTLCFGKSNAVMVEMPFSQWTEREIRDIEDIRNELGLKVIIAHIERYITWQKPDLVDALRLDAKAMIQSNAEYFLTRKTRRKAAKLLKERKINLLGSDCHNMTTRPPNLGQALEFLEDKVDLRNVQNLSETIFMAGDGTG